MTLLRWLWSIVQSPRRDPPKDSGEALRRAWVRDQILEARIRLLEEERLDGRR